MKVDPAALGAEAATLLVGLIREKLNEISTTATGDALAVATHFIPLLGLDGSLPAFPFATLGTDPQAVINWLHALAVGNPPPLAKWLVHLAGLLGVTAPNVTNSTAGTWSVALFAPNSTSSISIELVLGVAGDAVTQTLGLQIGASLVPSAGAAAALNAVATLFTVPLSGPPTASVLPAASIIVCTPPASTPLIAPSSGKFSLDGIQAGIRWNGTAITPLIELDNVVIPGAGTFPTINLSNANTVVASAASGLITTLLADLGASSGAGAHLAALAGLTEPATDTSAPLVDVTQLVTNPIAAITALHRNALVSAAQHPPALHPWLIYLSELAALLSLPTTVTGSGAPSDPWLVPIAGAGPWTLSLAAWNAQTSGNAADPQRLRIGIRAQAGSATAQLSWTSTLLAVDMPATGANQVSLFAEHEAVVTLQPPRFGTGTMQLNAASIVATFSLVAGGSANVQASVNGLALTTSAGTINVPTLPYPFPANFDPQNPAATLGISQAQLENLVAAMLLAALGDAFGGTGVALAVLLGCGAGAPGLPADLPGVVGVSTNTLFNDPAGALRSWIAEIATKTSAGGGDFATPVAGWLAALLSNNSPLPGFSPDLTDLGGTGTYGDPWILPLGDGASAAQGLLWLEPAGPASSAALAGADVAAAIDFPSLVSAVAAATRYLGAWPDGVDPTALAAGLQSLATYLSSSDGVVPLSSQLPTGGSWGTGTALGSAHPDQPTDPAAIGQILAQVDAWVAPGNPRAILLLGPAFSDHTIWAPLLVQAEAAHPGSTAVGALFKLRLPGVAPASIDLRPVTAVADYYTADLQDDGTNDLSGLVAQIGLIVARLNALRPGAALMLVAHSTAGVAACSYAAANASGVKGLITLGTPHQGAPLTPLVDRPTADALRVIADWLPGGLAAGPLQDALAHLSSALDGYIPPPNAGALPVAWPYPVADFNGAGTTTTGGVPALALGGQLGGGAGVDLLGSLQTALAARINAYVATPPTHLAFGVQMDLDLGASAGSSAPATAVVSADASLRIDVGRLALSSGAAVPPGPAQALTARASLVKAGGWLVGDPRSYAGGAPAVDIRVRSAQVGLTLALNGAAPQATPFAALHEAAFHGTTVPLVGWSDPDFAAAIGAIFSSMGVGAGAAPGSRLGNLLALLQALGIATVPADATTAIGIAADAVNALSVDPLGFLAPKLQAAFANGSIPGFTAAATDGFTAPIGTLPLEALVTLTPPTFGLRTTASGSGVTLGGAVTVTGSVALPLADMQPVVSAALQAGPASLAYANGTLTLQVTGSNTPLPLVPPPSAAQAAAAFTAMLPPLLISGVGSALIDGLLAPGNKIAGLYSFLQSPWNWLIQSSALGNGTVLDPAKLTALIGSIGTLPAGLVLSASASASGNTATTITLATAAPLGGVLTINAGITLDQTGHATPAVSFDVNAPATGGTGPQIALAFGASASGLSLVLTPNNASPIELLPSFDGAAALAGAANKLLPDALDGLLAAVTPLSPAVVSALNVASALGLYDSSGGFTAHATELATLTQGGWLGAFTTSARSAFITAANGYLNGLALPGAFSVSGSALVWSFALSQPPSALGSGSVTLTAGWDNNGPTIGIGTTNLAVTNGPATISLTAGYAGGKASLTGTVDVSLQTSLGLGVKPQLAFSLGGGNAATLALLPLGAGTASLLSLQLAPTVHLAEASGAAVQLVEDWVVPLVADLLIAATGTKFSQPAFPGGPTIETLLQNAKLIIGPSPNFSLATPLPGVDQILASLLQSTTATVNLAADPPLDLLLGSLGGQLGVALQGSITIATGSPTISLLFGQPGDGPTVPGVQLSLFTAGTTPVFAPSLEVRGIGAGFAGDGSDPLFNEAGVRIGSIDGFVAFSFDLKTAQLTGELGGGVQIGNLGLPFGLLDSVSTSNPVAASLLGSNSGSGNGDASSVNPALDVEISYLGSLSIKFAGTNEPIVIPVHASFGPLYIDQIDLALDGTDSVTIGIDGSVSINGLSVGLDELAVQIPISSILQPSNWNARSARARCRLRQRTSRNLRRPAQKSGTADRV